MGRGWDDIKRRRGGLATPTSRKAVWSPEMLLSGMIAASVFWSTNMACL